MPREEFTKENIFDLEEKGARRLKEEMAEKSICPRKNTCLLFGSELLLLSYIYQKKKCIYSEVLISGIDFQYTTGLILLFDSVPVLTCTPAHLSHWGVAFTTH